MSLRVVNWNVEWATASSRRSPEILRRIGQHAPEVLCLTETHLRLLPQDGHIICSQPDYGYPIKDGRRKIVLWSREPWEQVDDLGTDALPPGRFVSGVTQTSLGAVRVVGVCIPWFGSRTEARRNLERKMRWEDHGQYLAGLTKVLKGAAPNRLMVMGDFNQIVGPGCRAPSKLQLALQQAFPPGMRIVTSELAFQGRRSIDHIVLSDDFAVETLDVISNLHDGRRLSDHFGIVADLSARASH
ncbi:MAG: endonuclease/exonuclease/phosphatase family protein [Dehalococcoidia bacterium]|nr:endonuclease/exonuclease/phosphatase family protein [Dehalococcoidia bacterium]